MIEEHLHRSENLPTYWLEAAAAFDDDDDGSRIWELPGVTLRPIAGGTRSIRLRRD